MLYFNQKEVFMRKESFGGLISHIKKENYEAINELAYLILSKCRNGKEEKEVYQELVREGYNVRKNDILEFMLFMHKEGYLTKIPTVSKSEEKLKLYDKRLSAPIEVNIYPSYKCNQRCRFCYVDLTKKGSEMSAEEYNRYLLQANGWKESFTYSFLGGEPLVSIEKIFEICEKIPSNKKIVISTNGIVDDEKRASIIEKISSFSNMFVQVSMESSKESVHDFIVGRKGAFIKQKKFIEALQPYKKVYIHQVACPDNIDTVIETAAYCKKIGVHDFSVTNEFYNPNWDYRRKKVHEDINRKLIFIEEKLEELVTSEFSVRVAQSDAGRTSFKINIDDEIPGALQGCQGQNVEIDINPEGYVFPCGCCLDKAKYELGNIKNDSFEKIWGNREWSKAYGCPLYNGI